VRGSGAQCKLRQPLAAFSGPYGHGACKTPRPLRRLRIRSAWLVRALRRLPLLRLGKAGTDEVHQRTPLYPGGGLHQRVHLGGQAGFKTAVVAPFDIIVLLVHVRAMKEPTR
jgi:hypothetical protein